MANGDINGAKSVWVKVEIAAKIAQIIFAIIIVPLVGFLYSMSGQMAEIKTQNAVIAAKLNSMPRFDDLKTQIAVIEDRQNSVRIKLDDLSREFAHHQLFSDYDPESPRYTPRRNRLTK